MKTVATVAVPSKSVRFALDDEQWQASIDTWMRILHTTLCLPDQAFHTKILEDQTFIAFLLSYMKAADEEFKDDLSDSSRRISAVQALARQVFLLSIRTMRDPNCSVKLISVNFLVPFLHTFGKKNTAAIQQAVDTAVGLNSEALEAELTDSFVCLHSGAVATLCSFSDAVVSLLSRSQLARKLIETYDATNTDKKSLRKLAFVLMTSNQVSLKFLDALINADKPNRLLSDLLTRTSLSKVLREHSTIRPGLEDVVASLPENMPVNTENRDMSNSFLTDRSRGTGESEGEDHAIELLSKISQIRDLFPDLGEGYIEACLAAYDGDIETATMHLLEGDLPDHIAHMDKKDKILLAGDGIDTPTAQLPEIHSTERANIYDNDAFDRLEHDRSSVRQGRDISKDADAMLREKQSDTLKAKIISLAYDPDEDELDDTYETFETFAAVDQQTNEDLADGTGSHLPSIDDLLFMTYESSAGVFEKSARGSSERQDLKARTNLSDEQIEGWKVMLDREPKRLSQLASKHAFSGEQSELQSSKWSSTNSVSGHDTQAGRGRGGQRGRGGRGRGRGKGMLNNDNNKTPEQIKRERARKETRGHARGNGSRGVARPQG